MASPFSCVGMIRHAAIRLGPPVATSPLWGVYREESSDAGRVPRRLVLPGRVLGVQREIRISAERVRHIRARRREWAGFCLRHMGEVLGAPAYVGQTLKDDERKVEFVRRVGPQNRLLLVSVKFLDQRREAWISSAYPIDARVLTRRLRSGTLGEIRRGS